MMIQVEFDLVPAETAGTRHKEKLMLGYDITYELGKAIHEDRLKEAEQERLINTLKGVSSSPVKFKKWFWGFKLKTLFTPKPIKNESNEAWGT